MCRLLLLLLLCMAFILVLIAGRINGQQFQALNSFAFIFDNSNIDTNNDEMMSSLLLEAKSSYKPNETNNINVIRFDHKLNLFIEIVICTDYSVYQLHKQFLAEHLTSSSSTTGEGQQNEGQLVVNHIKAYYLQVIDGVNERYKMSFKNDDLSINVNVVDFYISTSSTHSPWSESPKYTLGYNENNNKIINAHDVLIDFNSWIESNRSRFEHEFDHAFAVTAYDIRGNTSERANSDYNGLGYISGICRPYYTGSLIEERGAYTSVRNFAHEMGHNIGAEHDENTECAEFDNYLMASNFHSYNRNNSWVFSPCSLKSIKQFLSLYENHACLLNKPKGNREFSSYTRLYPGQIYNPFEQCKQLYGVNSLPCFEFKSSICETLYCRKHVLDEECHWIAPAAEGTSCDENKLCLRGNCIRSFEAHNSDCFGDTILWIDGPHKKKSYSCQSGIELLSRKSGKTIIEICEEYNKQCCKTCERIRAFMTSSVRYENDEAQLDNNDSSKMLKSISDKTTQYNKDCKYNNDDSVCNMAYGSNYCRKRHLRKGTHFNDWCDKQCRKCN